MPLLRTQLLADPTPRGSEEPSSASSSTGSPASFTSPTPPGISLSSFVKPEMIMVGCFVDAVLVIFVFGAARGSGLVSGSPGSRVVGGRGRLDGQVMRGCRIWARRGERGGELAAPGPAGGDLDQGATAAADDPGGGVQQPVAE